MEQITQIESVKAFWRDIESHNWESLESRFHKDAVIDWNNQNERFNVKNFVKANSEYPGKWRLTVEKAYELESLVIAITLTEVIGEDGSIVYSLYANSFFTFEEGLITHLSEYYSENTPPPEWRQKLNLATKIK